MNLAGSAQRVAAASNFTAAILLLNDRFLLWRAPGHADGQAPGLTAPYSNDICWDAMQNLTPLSRAVLLDRLRSGVLQVGGQPLEVRRWRRPRQRLVMPQQRQVSRVRLEVGFQPRGIEQLQPQLLGARLRVPSFGFLSRLSL